MRLYEITDEQLADWIIERRKIGKEKYGNAHLKRYNLVDVTEELLDAINIMGLFKDRLESTEQNTLSYPFIEEKIKRDHQAIVAMLYNLIFALQELDKYYNDDVCTDEFGGRRIWWSDQISQDIEHKNTGSLTRKYKPKKCDECGQVFIPNSGRARYCFDCRREVQCRQARQVNQNG